MVPQSSPSDNPVVAGALEAIAKVEEAKLAKLAEAKAEEAKKLAAAGIGEIVTETKEFVKYVNHAGHVEKAEVLGRSGNLAHLRIFGSHKNDVQTKRNVPLGNETTLESYFV